MAFANNFGSMLFDSKFVIIIAVAAATLGLLVFYANVRLVKQLLYSVATIPGLILLSASGASVVAPHTPIAELDFGPYFLPFLLGAFFNVVFSIVGLLSILLGTILKRNVRPSLIFSALSICPIILIILLHQLSKVLP